MIKKILLPILSVLIVAILSISFLLQTEHVKKLVEKEIGMLIENQTGSPISIEGLYLQFPLIVEAEKIQSEQFNLRHVYVKLSVLNLLRGDIVIRKIHADSLEISTQDTPPASFALKNIPHFHIDFFSIRELLIYPTRGVHSTSYSVEGEIHSGDIFSGSLIVQQNNLKHPFHFEINGWTSKDGITAQMLCRHQEDYIQGSLTLKETETALSDMKFSFMGIQGEGSAFLNAKKEWDGTHIKLTVGNLYPYYELYRTRVCFVSESPKCGITGDATIETSLSGAFTEPYFDLTFHSQRLIIKEIAHENCLIHLIGQWKSEALEASVQGLSFVHQNAITGSCQLAWDHQKRLQLTDIQLSTKDLNGHGNCTIHADSRHIQGNLRGEIPHYNTVYELTLDKDQDNKQKGHLIALSSGFIYEDKSFSKLTLEADFHDIFELPKGSFKFLCENLNSDTLNLNQINIQSTIDLSKSTYPFSVITRYKEGILQAQGFWNLQQVEVANCFGDILGYPFELKDAFMLTFDSTSFRTTPIAAYLQDGMIAGSFEKNAESFQVNAKIHKLPLQLLQLSPTWGINLKGDADIIVALGGPQNNMEGSLDINLNQVETLSPLPPFDATLQATLSNQRLNFEGVLKAGINPILLSGQLTKESIALHFEAKDEITQFMQLLFLQNAVHMTGAASVMLDVEGTLQDPIIRGEVMWTNGTFEHPETGILYKGISGSLTANGNELMLNQISAVDSEGGTLTGSGSMQLNSKQQHPFSLDLAIKNTQLLNLDYATATGNGTLKLSGNIQRALLSGTIQADSLKVRIPDEARPNIPTLAVNYINQSPDEALPSLVYRAPSAWPIALDLACEIQNPISIKGKNLRSTWTGNLHIKGETSTPLLYGDFKVITGEYNFRGKIFDIKEGTIFFSGDKNTSLYVVGSQEIDDIQADVILKGPLKSPELSLRSNPAMPQREIVSYILFGHRSSELTPFQGTELSESITDLNTTYKPDLLSRLTEKIGIDKLDISSSDVKVGKYISKGVLISFDKSMNAEANHLSIEAKVIKDVKLEGQISDDAEGQLNIKWKKDY